MVETNEAEDHQVIEELQRGYKLKDRLLRPADGQGCAQPQALDSNRKDWNHSGQQRKTRLLRSPGSRPRTRASRRSRAPIASWRCSIIPTATRTIPTRKRNSKSAAKPTRSWPMCEKRAAYDRFGHAAVSGAGAGGFDPTSSRMSAKSSAISSASAIFRRRRGRRRSRAQRGADLREDITLEFEEAVFGTETTVTVRRHETCEECHGSGAPRQSSGHLPLLRRPRPGALSARVLQHGAHLSHVPGRGQRDHRSLPQVQGRRPRAAAENGRSKSSRRRGRRNPHPFFRTR